MSQWVRLWEDMPTDPKWRVIARKSGQSIGNVIAVFNFMMVCAANATERGELVGWNDESVAAGLDLEESDILAIREAMQGRVLDGSKLIGWSKRQPKREDGAPERAREWRERKKLEQSETERNRTQPNAKEPPEEIQRREDPDKIESSLRSDSKPPPKKTAAREQSPLEILKSVLSEQTALDVIVHRKAKRSPLTSRAAKLLAAAFRDHGDAEAAAEAMIANGWQGFRSDWLAARARDGPSGNGRSNGSEGFLKLVMPEIIEALNGENQTEAADAGASGGQSGIDRAFPMLPGKRD